MEDINKKLDNIINLLEEDKKNQIRSKNERIYMGAFRCGAMSNPYYQSMFSIFGKGGIKQIVLKTIYNLDIWPFDILVDGKKVFSENLAQNSNLVRDLFGGTNTNMIHNIILGPFTFNRSFVIAGLHKQSTFWGTVLYTLDEEETE